MTASRAASERVRFASGLRVWTALGVVYTVWGSTYLAIRVAVRTLPPLLHGATRFLAAGTILYLFLLWRRGRAGMRVSRDELAATALTGGLFLLGGNGLLSIAEQEVASARAALIIASVPLWIVLLRALTGQRIAPQTLAGVALGFGGVALLVAESGSGAAPLGGQLLMVAAAASWASSSFLSQRVRLPADPLLSTALQMLWGGVLLVGAAAATGEFASIEPSRFSPESLVALGYLVVFGSLLAFTSYTWVLQHAPVSKVATYAYVNPVIAVFLGWLILSEAITSRILLAAGVILVSVAFIVRHETRAAAAAAPEGAAASPHTPGRPAPTKSEREEGKTPTEEPV
ncbi:MAG TPA: EamA family transporter [Actinomycetota bacterium]|nr:EamA family transporter [Actinomycetota bacterium]